MDDFEFWGIKPKKKVFVPDRTAFRSDILRQRMNNLNQQRRQLLRLKRKQYVREAVNQRKAIRTFSNVLFGSKNIAAAREKARAAGVRLQAEGLAGYGRKGADAVRNKINDFVEKNRGVYDRKLRNPFKRETVIYQESKEEYDKRKKEGLK